MGYKEHFILAMASTAITTLLLGIFVLIQDRKNKLFLTFSLYSFSISWWCFSQIGNVYGPSLEASWFWARFEHIGVIFIPTLFLHFTILLLGLKNRGALLRTCYVISAIIAATFPTNLISPNAEKKVEGLINFGEPGVLYPFILLFFISLTIYCLTKIVKAYVNSDGNRKIQLGLLFWSSLIGYIGGSGNFLLVYDISIYPLNPFGTYFVALYVLVTFYAIFKYNFLNIEVIIKRTLVFTGLSVAVVGIFVLATFLIQDILGEIVGIPKIWSLIISAIIIVASLDPIKNFLVNTTDKYLFQKKYNPAELIKTFSKTVLTELDLDKIAESTVDKLSEALKLTSCAILIPSREGNKFTIRKSYGISDKKISYEKNAPMMSYLSSVNSIILKENEKSLSKTILKDMNMLSANVCIAVMMRKELIGVLCLGKKKSDQEYTKDDIDILLLLADALGVAITNALAFEDVRQKEKLAAIGMLAAGIKHDIGTPINKMSSAIQLFLMERDEGDHKKIPIPEVLSSAYDLLSRSQMTFSQISRISAKFADFAKPKRHAELELVNVSESIEEALSVLECDIHARGVSVKKNIQKDISPVRADREYMQEILFNIIKNAAQAIHEAHRDKGESIITITAKEEPKKNIVVEIKDTGVGIPEDALDKVFEEYYTTKQEKGGTGLGLAIVKELVGRNNGKISVRSELGKGSTFILKFTGASNDRK